MSTKSPIIMFASTSCVQAHGQTADARKLQSSLIWDASTALPDTVPSRQSWPVSVGFRKQLNLPEMPASATLQIFADSRYLLWINGRYAARGPNRFDPKRPEYDTLDVAPWLKKGMNTLAVLVQGGLSNYRFIYHQPGLGLFLETRDKDGRVLDRTTTDTTWRSSAATRFGPPNVLLSGITDRIDERRELDDWLAPEFDDSAWKTAVRVDGNRWGKLYKRMIPLLRETRIEGGQILKIVRGEKTDETKRPLNEAMPLELTAPATVMIDMGQMVRAWFELDFESECESQLELLPRQSYDPDRTAGFLGSCQYQTTARAGRRTYCTTDDYTCRLVYLQLHTGKIKIHGLKVVERRYPFDRIGHFRCNDDFLNELWEMSMRTSEVNANDGYIDGSEGGEWVSAMIDYPVTQVAFSAPGADGKPIYGDMRLVANQISRMALSQEGAELLKAWHPCDWHRGPRDNGTGIHNFIEDSAAFWVNQLRLYYDGTGDRALVEREWPVLETMMKWFLDRRTERGLVNAREFFLHFDNPIAFHVCEGATLNAFVYGALVDAAWLAEKLGKKDRAAHYAAAAHGLAEAYNTHLWDASSGTYYAGLMPGEKKLISRWPHEPWKAYYASIDQSKEFFPPTVQAAVAALSRGLVPENRRASVQKYFFNHHNELVSPRTYLCGFEAFYRMNTKEADQEALDTMRKRWAVMVGRKMPGTLGETFDDTSYFCLDFGPIASAFLAAYVLGVRNDGPIGNKRIIIEPRLGDLTVAEGVVVTWHGLVPVTWKRGAGNRLDFDIEVPDGVTATVSIPRPSDKPILKIDGKIERRAKPENRFLIVELGPGKHTGTIGP